MAGEESGAPTLTLPAGVMTPPAMVKTLTVPSDRLATRARVPARLIDTPEAPAPARRVAVTFRVFRSITLTTSSGTMAVGSAGSILRAEVTRANDPSGATATLDGGPITLVGAATSADDARRRGRQVDQRHGVRTRTGRHHLGPVVQHLLAVVGRHRDLGVARVRREARAKAAARRGRAIMRGS